MRVLNPTALLLYPMFQVTLYISPRVSAKLFNGVFLVVSITVAESRNPRKVESYLSNTTADKYRVSLLLSGSEHGRVA